MLGQNFLDDPVTVARIVQAAQPDRDDLIIEIGAGRGGLTRSLARTCRALIACEIDVEPADRLARELRNEAAVRVVSGDFLATRPPREPFAIGRHKARLGLPSRAFIPALKDGSPARIPVALGFSGVGGSLRASLRREYPRRRVDAALRAGRMASETVVGYVWPEQWIALFRAVHRARD